MDNLVRSKLPKIFSRSATSQLFRAFFISFFLIASGNAFALSAPSVSVPSSDSDGNFTVSWSSVSGATSYDIRVSLPDGQSFWQHVYNGSGTSVGQSRSPGQYGYIARACNSSGCSPWGTRRYITVTEPPPPPAPSSAPSISVPSSDSDGNFTVSWSSVSGATSYDIRVSLPDGQSFWQHVYNGSGTSVGQSRSPGQYGYIARACNSSGCSGWGTRRYITVTEPTPGIPTVSVPSSDAVGNFTVSWNSVAHASSYDLRVSLPDGQTNWQVVYNGSNTSVSQSRSPGTYGYIIRACNSSGSCSGWGTRKFITVAAPPTISVPSSDSDGNFTVSWNSTSGATSYDIRVSLPDGQSNWQNVYNGSGTSVAQSRTPGIYGYIGRNCNGSGCGEWGVREFITVEEQNPPPTVSASWNQSTINLGESISLNWSAEHVTSCTDDNGVEFVGNQDRASPWVFTPTQEGPLSLTLTCTGEDGSTVSGVATANVDPAVVPDPYLGFTTDYQTLLSTVDGTTIVLTKNTNNSPSVGDIELVWNGSTYTPQTLASTSGSWQSIAADMVLGDFNVDGFIDVFLKDINSVIPAIPNLVDQIVFSGTSSGSAPQAVTALDQDLQQFFSDIQSWMLNPNYFAENAPLVDQTIIVEEILINAPWWCDIPPYNDTIPDPVEALSFNSRAEGIAYLDAWADNCINNRDGQLTRDNVPIRYPQTVQVPDFSVFNQDAVVVTQDMESVIESGGSVEGVATVISENMGVDVFGTGDSAITDSEEDVPEHLRGRTRLQLFLLNILKILGDNANTGEYHEIEPVVTEICSTTQAGCTLGEVFCELRTFPAPGMWSNTTPVQNGEVNNAEIGYQNTTVDDLGPVVHTVDEVNRTVTNDTLPGHLLHPGTVVRSVEQVGDTISIRTEGDGTGAYPNTNEILAEDLWTITDSQIISEQSKKVLGGNSCLQ